MIFGFTSSYLHCTYINLQVGLEKKLSQNTLISYVTTGVLLQTIIHAKSLFDYTHIIVDEVHERTQEMDFLLLLVRRFLYTNSRNVKVFIRCGKCKSVAINHSAINRLF